ncbi:MAG: ImmA/IrrE family metallo-endopeptidase [Planctomycetota bacterium]
MHEVFAHEDLAAALDATASELLWEASVTGPPVDAFAVAGELGLFVAEDDRLAPRGRFSRLGGISATPVGAGAAGAGPTPQSAEGLILLRTEPRRERRQWAVAHEVGEYAASRVYSRLGVQPCDTRAGAREAVANGLAGRLLLPSGWFRPDATRFDYDLLTLKRRYATASHELIARRVLELAGLPAAVTVFDHGSVTWRRASLGWNARSPLDPAEQATWRRCHTTGGPTECLRPPLPLTRVRCWPIHEPGWRREIMISELCDAG